MLADEEERLQRDVIALVFFLTCMLSMAVLWVFRTTEEGGLGGTCGVPGAISTDTHPPPHFPILCQCRWLMVVWFAVNGAVHAAYRALPLLLLPVVYFGSF